VTEKVHLGGAAREHGEVPEREEVVGKEWAVQGRAQGQQGNVFVRNAARLYRMRLEFPVTIGSAPNAVKKW
jgi:hypothetical protein